MLLLDVASSDPGWVNPDHSRRRPGYQAVEEWDRYIRQTALNIPLSALLRIRPRVRRDKLQIFYHIWYFWKIRSTETILICIIRISGNCNWIAMWFSDHFSKFHLLWIAPLCTGTLWPAPTRTAPRGATTSHSRGSTFPSPPVATSIAATAGLPSVRGIITQLVLTAKVLFNILTKSHSSSGKYRYSCQCFFYSSYL